MVQGAVTVDLRLGDCLDIMPTLDAASVDAIITDPPYAEIDRPYGRLTEAEWWDLMMGVCKEARRILKPTGSAVFILQPNSERIGTMRLWLWKFMVWCGENWNIVQDAYWWNFAVLPTHHASQHGLMRGTVKTFVWVGNPDCYRNQSAVLWEESESNRAKRMQGRAGFDKMPSGHVVNIKRCVDAAERRGGVTPFNLLPFSNANSQSSAGANGHGAGTPLELAKWWTRYICPTGGTVLDPFMGSGTMGLAALEYGDSFVGIEKMPDYFEIAKQRIEAQQQMTMVLA